MVLQEIIHLLIKSWRFSLLQSPNVLNTTFTAGGLKAPIFVVVYGLGVDEMQNDDVVTVPLKGLTIVGNRNLYSEGNGYITFVTGKSNNTDMFNSQTNNNQDDNNDHIDESSTPNHEHNETLSHSNKAKNSPFVQLLNLSSLH